MNFWRTQKPNSPLFRELLWSRPETLAQRGRLLIIGGNQHSFSEVHRAYTAALGAMVGECRILLPDVLSRLLRDPSGPFYFAASTPSGSFATGALGTMLDQAALCDGVLLAGELSSNSETASVVRSFVSKYPGPLVIAGDCVGLLKNEAALVFSRPRTVLVAPIGQLQGYAKVLNSEFTPSSSAGPAKLAEVLHHWTSGGPIAICTAFGQDVFVAVSGQVVTCEKALPEGEPSLTTHAAAASVWYLQNSKEPLESIVSSLVAF